MDCPPPLDDLMHMTTAVEDGVKWVTAHVETDTYLQFADYSVTIDGERLIVQGTGDRHNYRKKNNRIWYMQRVRPPAGTYPLVNPPADSYVCWDGEELNALFVGVVLPAANDPFSISYSAELFLAADLNLDGKVDSEDIGLIFIDWGGWQERSDLNNDGTIDGFDLGILMTQWTG